MSVVVLTYRSSPTIEACLRSVAPGLGDLAGEIIVVDNGSDDGSAETADAIGRQIPVTTAVVPLKENRGFAAGCNIGLARARAPWVLFLNPDATCTPAGIEHLVRVARTRPDAGIVAPVLVGSDGQLQPTIERTLRLGRVLAGMARVGGANRPSVPPDGGPPIEVPWVHGAAMLMPTALARRVGGFDERFFLHAEDMDLCTRVADVGRKVLVAPEVRFTHMGGASMERSGGDAFVAASRTESLALYLRLHQGRWASLLYSGAGAIGYRVAATVERLLGRDSAVHRSMAAAALRSLRDR